MKYPIYLLTILLTLWTTSANAQDPTREQQNTFYVTAGLVYSGTVGYERVLTATKRKRGLARALYGKYWEFFGDRGDLFSLQYVHLMNWKKFHNLEWGIGAVYETVRPQTPEDLKGSKVFPAAHVGYRLQKPRGFVFRTGIGFPEAVYVGVGLGF